MPQSPSLADLLPAVIDIARRAAGAILEVYDGEFAVEHKDDRSPLTAADRAAHGVIVARAGGAHAAVAGVVGGIGRRCRMRSAGPGSATGWSIRWTARASS